MLSDKLISDELGDKALKMECNLLKNQEGVKKAKDALRRLCLACTCCFLFMTMEFVGGWLANSVAIYSDALHMVSNFAGLLINIFGLRLTLKTPSSSWMYGYHRLEIVAAILSIVLLWVMTTILCIEAAQRFVNPPKVNAELMIITSTFGIVNNIILACILIGGGHGHSHFGISHGHSHKNPDSNGHRNEEHGYPKHQKCHGHGCDNKTSGDLEQNTETRSNILQSKSRTKSIRSINEDGATKGSRDLIHSRYLDENNGKWAESEELCQNPDGFHAHCREDTNVTVQSAFVHAIGDMLQNVGVLIAGIMIWWDEKYRLMDPICTFVFASLVLFVTAPLVYRAFYVLMDTVPKSVDSKGIMSDINGLKYVKKLRDLHIWNVSYTDTALTAKVEVSCACKCQQAVAVREQIIELAEDMDIQHCNVDIRVVPTH